MSGFERRISCTALLLALLITTCPPPAASGEPLLLLHTTHTPAPPVHRADRQEMSIGLNDQGDMVIQQGPLALIVACLSPEIPIDIPEQHGMAQRQETAGAGGISVRFNLSF